MKRFGLAVAAALLALSAPLAAHAAPSKEAPKAKPYEKEQLAKGAKEAPAVLARAGVRCTPTASAYAGSGTIKDPTTKKDVKQNVYEVACQEGLGYLMIDTVGGDVKAYDCVLLASAPGNKCNLPVNLDPKSQLQPLVASTGRTCPVANVRSLGSTATGDSYYEVACQGAEGFILKTSAKGAKPEITECAVALGSKIECTFTTKEQIQAAQKAKLTALVAKSGRTCATMTGTRMAGKLTSGDELYEVACGTTGFMIQASADGSKATAVDCSKADALYAGGCELTNAAVSQQAESATYTRLANAAGFPCTVSKYRFIGVDQKTKAELVELACSNRADGGMGLFPTDNSKGTVYDCVAAESFSQKCRLTEASLVYGKYTQALVAKGKTTCKVSNARFIGRNSAGGDLIETACADGQPGWVVELASNQVKSLFTCGQAKASGVTCQLGGNTK